MSLNFTSESMNATHNGTGFNETLQEMCPIFTETEEKVVQYSAFWIDGVAKTTLAVLGVFSNLLAAYILNQNQMRNSFNLCLVSLSVIDTIFLVGSILESFRRRFRLVTSLHIILYPQLLYPLSSISLTASIYMIVAITLERYCAVHYPLNYRQATSEPKLMRRRMLRYLLPVIGLSVLVNISKFFEAYVDKRPDGTYTYSISPLRRNMTYSAVTNWMRVVLLSTVPLAIIIYFNFKVYKDIRERSLRRSNQRRAISVTKGSPETKASVIPTTRSCIELQTLNNCNQIEQDANSIRTKDDSPVVHSNENRRMAEDKLAGIFLFIILGFILCHLPRVALDVHEIATLEHYNMCRAARVPHVFPAWSFVAINISHFCLVLSATMNMYIYCYMSTRFREELLIIVGKIKACFCRRNRANKSGINV